MSIRNGDAMQRFILASFFILLFFLPSRSSRLPPYTTYYPNFIELNRQRALDTVYNYILCFDWYFGLRCLEKPGFVTPANVVEIFHENDVPKDFDMLSLDTDGFEWLLWLKLQKAGDKRFVKDRGFFLQVCQSWESQTLRYLRDVFSVFAATPNNPNDSIDAWNVRLVSALVWWC